MGTMPKRKRAAKPTAGNPWPKRLKKLRDRLGLNQTQAGEKIGVSQNLWSAWERGTRTPDASRQLLITLLSDGKLA